MTDATRGFRFFNLSIRLVGIRALRDPAGTIAIARVAKEHMRWLKEEIARNGNPTEPAHWVELVPALIQARILVGDVDDAELRACSEPLDSEFRRLVASVSPTAPDDFIRYQRNAPTPDEAASAGGRIYERGTLRRWAEQLQAEDALVTPDLPRK